MNLTTDPKDPRLPKRSGPDMEPTPMQDVYLVLSEEERAKGFVRPLRDRYIHIGKRPKHPTLPLTEEQQERYGDVGYVAFEPYPKEEGSTVTGRFWTQAELDSGCGMETTMGSALSETYARSPHFYGATYCVHCRMHRPVGEKGEFVWSADGKRVGT